MPCPHNEITIVQRSQRQSAVAAAAYQSGEKLFCEYDQQVKHYPEKRGIVHNEILLPANAPPEYADRNTLWNAAEAVEKQWNSQLARRWVLTIPREIPSDQYAALVREFCQQQFVSKGMIVDFAIHDPHPPGHNPHAHVMLTTLAATRLIALHKNKGMTVAACLKNRTDYIENPDKTEQGQHVSSYACSALTADEEFMLTKRQYELATGRRQKNDVIAYQIRQSFRPGEVSAEEANKVGYELAMRFTKGKYAFIVATHTDREHIHNHIIYNSTALDGTRKFRDFLLSGLAVQRLSDLICLEHQLSVIEIKPYRERQKRTLYPPKESNRDRLCSVIDNILAEKPKDYEDFLQKLEQQGYEVKRGKYTSVKGARQKRFIRFRTLGAGYSEEELKAVLAGEAEHLPRQKCPAPEQKFQMLVDIQAKLAEGKGTGFARWAKQRNLKEMSRTLVFLQENKIGSIEEMQERVDAATARYHELGDSIKASEKRLAEIAVLKAHIINYAKTRPVYDAYRKTGYSKRFLETHRTEITLHKAAKAAFDEANLKTLPKVKELDAEYSKLLTEKKALYPGYRKAKEEMQELLRAQKNIELFFDEEKNPEQTEHSR